MLIFQPAYITSQCLKLAIVFNRRLLFELHELFFNFAYPCCYFAHLLVSMSLPSLQCRLLWCDIAYEKKTHTKKTVMCKFKLSKLSFLVDKNRTKMISLMRSMTLCYCSLFFLHSIIFIDWMYCNCWGREIPGCLSVCLSVCVCACVCLSVCSR